MTGLTGIDELTGLVSHDAFRSWLTSALEEGMKRGASDALTLVYFNVQNFKGYNEHYGFEAGNELLLLLADAIEHAYPDCVASRFAADQFMVATARTHAVKGINQVRAAFRAHHKDSSIWLKAGLYVTRPGDMDAGVACDRAKLACDDIKGRRDVFYREYDAELQGKIALHRYVLDHFDEALEKGWVKIYYQPIVRVASGEVCDEEALARWVDPVEGLIAPNDFIPVLEEARLVHRLDLYMVRRACENSAKLARDGYTILPVSVNLSRIDFELCDIVEEVKAILSEYGISHNMLSIEVTESALAGNQEFLRGEIDRFRDEGFEVWIDDFGSGYSSLAMLTEYSFDLVKVDMGFLEGFDNGRASRIMLAHIIGMAKELGLKTLVEGVETAEQYAFLKSIGCGRAQGFLLGRPASLAESEQAMARQLYPRMELLEKRGFYEDVGRVNLMRPDPAQLADEPYVPSDVAAAIVRRRGSVYDFLNTSDLFVKFMRDARIGTPADIERILNGDDSKRKRIFERVFDACIASGTWEHYAMEESGLPCTMRMRCVSNAAEKNAAAVLIIVE